MSVRKADLHLPQTSPQNCPRANNIKDGRKFNAAGQIYEKPYTTLINPNDAIRMFLAEYFLLLKTKSFYNSVTINSIFIIVISSAIFH